MVNAYSTVLTSKRRFPQELKTQKLNNVRIYGRYATEFQKIQKLQWHHIARLLLLSTRRRSESTVDALRLRSAVFSFWFHKKMLTADFDSQLCWCLITRRAYSAGRNDGKLSKLRRVLLSTLDAPHFLFAYRAAGRVCL